MTEPNRDFYKDKASKMFGVPYDEVTNEQRAGAKKLLMDYMYGRRREPLNGGTSEEPFMLKAQAVQMKSVGRWDFCNPDEYVGYVSEATMLALKESAHIPYCSICGKDALFKSSDNGAYSYALSDYCPSCGAILNQGIYNRMHDDLKEALGSNEVD